MVTNNGSCKHSSGKNLVNCQNVMSHKIRERSLCEAKCMSYEGGSCVGYAYSSDQSFCHLYAPQYWMMSHNCPLGFKRAPQATSTAYTQSGFAETSNDLIKKESAEWVCYRSKKGDIYIYIYIYIYI